MEELPVERIQRYRIFAGSIRVQVRRCQCGSEVIQPYLGASLDLILLEVARLSHAEAQRDYVLERDRRARLRARAEALGAVRNGGTHDPRVGEIRPSG
jgi:hypothetical protein